MPKAKGQTMTAQAYERIRADILTGRLKPNEKIKISDLVSKLGFSLGAVREALSRLSSEGLAVTETNKGFRVAPITEEDLVDLTRTRILIETECLKNAIENGDLKWETGIVSTLFEITRIPVYDPDDPQALNPEWVDAHQRFHEALVAACDSPWLLRIRDSLFAQSERYRSATASISRLQRDLNAEHKAIADAAIARDTEAAVEAMRKHLSHTRKILLDAHLAQTAAPPAEAAS